MRSAPPPPPLTNSWIRACIPAGHVRDYSPSFSPEIRGLMKDWKRLRSALPSPESLERIRELTDEINAKVLDHTSNLWKEFLNSIDHRTNPSKLGKVVRSLFNRNSSFPAGHEAILSLGSTLIPSPREQADLLVKHYASISRLPHCREDRRIKRRFHDLAADSSIPSQFTPEMVSAGIKRAGQSTARGPDGIPYPHLKHLCPTAFRVLAGIFNMSVRLNTIPT